MVLMGEPSKKMPVGEQYMVMLGIWDLSERGRSRLRLGLSEGGCRMVGRRLWAFEPGGAIELVSL